MMGRHGRNLRQRVADAKAREHARTVALAKMRRAEQALLSDMRSKLQDAEAFNREVARIVGRASILAGAPTHQMFEEMPREDVRERGIRVPLPPPRRGLEYFWGDAKVFPLEEVRVEVLRMLDFEVVQDQMSAAMHLRVTLADSEVRYAISRTALRTLDREELARRLVHELLVGLMPKIGR